MTFSVMADIELQTPDGPVTLHEGQIIRLATTEAIVLIEAGRIKPTKRVAYRIYSEILQAYLWIVETDHDMHSLKAEGVSEAIYTGDELKKLKASGMDKEGLKVVHNIKQSFDGSQVKAASRVK